MNIKIMLSTTRPGRKSEVVGNWVLKEVSKLDTQNTYEILDLEKLNLPFFDEMSSPMMGDYQNKHTKEWSKIVEETDGFIIALAEYNGGYPAPVKNAIDYLYNEWNNKPIALVGYGSRGAESSIKQLTEVMSRMKINVLSNVLKISEVWAVFDKEGNIDLSKVKGSLSNVIEEFNQLN